MSDLREICEDGASQLQATMPDISYEGDSRRHDFVGEDAGLSVQVWNDYWSPVQEDTLVSAGEILATNRRLGQFAYTIKIEKFDSDGFATPSRRSPITPLRGTARDSYICRLRAGGAD